MKRILPVLVALTIVACKKDDDTTVANASNSTTSSETCRVDTIHNYKNDTLSRYSVYVRDENNYLIKVNRYISKGILIGSSTYTRNSNGKEIKRVVTDSLDSYLNYTSTSEYNSKGLLSKQTTVRGKDSDYYIIYEYDKNGNRTKITQHNLATDTVRSVNDYILDENGFIKEHKYISSTSSFSHRTIHIRDSEGMLLSRTKYDINGVEKSKDLITRTYNGDYKNVKYDTYKDGIISRSVIYKYWKGNAAGTTYFNSFGIVTSDSKYKFICK